MNFDRLAPHYRVMEAVTAGGKLQRCRMAFLDEIPAPSRVLIAGEGHGRFLPELVRRFPDAAITVVDSSQAMLSIAKTEVPGSGVDFVHADLCNWQPDTGNFDLIVTHFFLDCFPPELLNEVVSRLAKAAGPDANWLLADFQIAPGGISGTRSRLILSILYRFFRITCGLKAKSLVAPDPFLEAAGFMLGRRITLDWELLKSEWWQRRKNCLKQDNFTPIESSV